MEFTNEARLIEAILFLEGEPVDIKSLARITQLSKDVVLKAIITLQDEYKKEYHGLEVLEETKIIEVKQGPYIAEKDKEILNE